MYLTPARRNGILRFVLNMAVIFLIVAVVNITLDQKWRSVYRYLASAVTGSNQAPARIPQEITTDTLKAMSLGGYTLFIRHATQHDLLDPNAFDRYATLVGGEPHPTFTTSMCISEQGRAETWLMKQVFEKANIPVGKVYSSPVCRARETAELVFDHIDVIDQSLNYQSISDDVSAQEQKAARARFRNIIQEAPPPGANKVVVSHQHIFNVASGYSWGSYSLRTSGMLIIRHDENNELTPVAVATLRSLVFALPLEVRTDYTTSQKES
jgi:phosphohistidine phosphatase SixA